MISFNNSWDKILCDEFSKPYYIKLQNFLKMEYETETIYPPMVDIYNAFKYTEYDKVKVVIIGQDPYHGEAQAHGLSFSVKMGVKPPPSLVNIYKELQSELSVPIPKHGELTAWAKQGVLLLNTVLTVRSGKPNSHKGKGWEIFTDKVIEQLNQRELPMVFLLWGANAKSKAKLITNKRHLILENVHPSPLSAYNGFFGSGQFKHTNEFLVKNGMSEIDWNLTKLV